MKEAVIGLGSNIKPEANIKNALAHLYEAFDVLKESQFIQTKPVGLTDQPDFINGAILISTDLNLKDLDARLKELEIELGREKSAVKFGPRTIDLDILVFNNDIVDQDVYDREFLMNSVLELIPNIALNNTH